MIIDYGELRREDFYAQWPSVYCYSLQFYSIRSLLNSGLTVNLTSGVDFHTLKDYGIELGFKVKETTMLNYWLNISYITVPSHVLVFYKDAVSSASVSSSLFNQPSDWENITPQQYLNYLREVFKYFKVRFPLPVGIQEIDVRLILNLWEALEEHYQGRDIKQALEAVNLKSFIALIMGEGMVDEAADQAGLMLACGLLGRLTHYADDLKEKINSRKFKETADVVSRMLENILVKMVRKNQGDFAMFDEVTIAGVKTILARD